MSRSVEESNRRLLRARDAIDRAYPEPLDVPTLARTACMLVAHFIRSFQAVFGETPHRYLQRRRVERAMYLLRQTERSVTEVCLDAGFTSLGTFSRTFHEIVGAAPSEYRRGEVPDTPDKAVPTCFAMAWGRPSSFGEASSPGAG
jgi:transcriptional regulator GlxA family with amidase domain